MCGYPAVVIDRPFILDAHQEAARVQKAFEASHKARERTKSSIIDDSSEDFRYVARSLGAPTQYLGMIAGLNHNVDQSGGTTVFVLTHARSHRVTEDDFLDIMSVELTRLVATEYKSTVIDAEEVLKKGDWAKIKLLMDITDPGLQNKMVALTREEAVAASGQNPNSGTQESPKVEERSEATDFLDKIESAGELIPLLNMPIPERDLTLVVATPSKPSPSNRQSFRGKVQKVRAKQSQTEILIPDFPGKLKVGGVGPLGGKIIQIQCFSDLAVLVEGSEINQSVGPVVYYKEVFEEGDIVIPCDYVDSAGNLVDRDGVTHSYDDMPPLIDDMGASTSGKIIKTIQRRTKKRLKDKGLFPMWRHVAIYEEVNVPKSKRLSKLLPIEEALRPPWFSPLYSNWFIGEQIYEKFFGCGSIVDIAYFTSPFGSGGFGTGQQQQREMLDKLQGAGNDTKTVLGILSDAEAKNISDVPDVESSVDVLAYVYGSIKRMGLDSNKFINDYIKRPIATMENIFGSSNLAYKVVKTEVTNKKGKKTEVSKLELVAGTPGFHSTAILGGELGKDLLGLVDNPDQPLPRLHAKGKEVTIYRGLDPRPGRRKRVEDYMKELGYSGLSLGVGVEG